LVDGGLEVYPQVEDVWSGCVRYTIAIAVGTIRIGWFDDYRIERPEPVGGELTGRGPPRVTDSGALAPATIPSLPF
jgi:hypothetical protein